MADKKRVARTIMHVDMDAFFAAIEMLDDPRLAGKPVIVGARPGSRGVVSTCSYEARKFGLGSAMPIARAYRLCPHGVYLRPRMKRYAEVSRQVMKALARISPVVEPISVDEAFVDLTGLEELSGSAAVLGRKTKKVVLEATGLTCSVGIGPNRLVAKIASDFDKPDGLTVVAPGEVLDFLAPLPVSRLRGVGRVLLRKLEKAGIATVKELRRRSRDELVRFFGASTGESLHRQSRGIASDRVGRGGERKSISKEVTFNEDVTDREILRRTMLAQAAEVGSIARREGVTGRSVHVKIRLQGFETHTRSRTLDRATSLDDEIFKTGWALFEKSGYADSPVRLIGIGISGLERGGQLDLFENSRSKKKQLMEAKDRIVARFGKDAIGFGSLQKKKKRQDGGHDENELKPSTSSRSDNPSGNGLRNNSGGGPGSGGAGSDCR